MLDFSSKMDRAAALALVRLAEQERARYISADVAALFGWLGRAIGHVVAALVEGKDASRLYAELSRMTDRQLEDIGITRSDIPAFVSRAVKHSEAQADAANDDSAEAARQAA